MNLKNLLTVKLIALSGLIFIFFCVYFLVKFNSFSEKNFEENLKESTTNFVTILNFDQMNQMDYGAIIPNQSIVIYNDSNNICFEKGEVNKAISHSIFEKLSVKDTFQITSTDTSYLAFNYVSNNKTFKVIAFSINTERNSFIHYLKGDLLSFLIFVIFILILLVRLIAYQTFIPINKIIMKIGKVSESNLNERVFIGNGEGEIANLAIVFNQMLDKLENAFKLQKTFVSNASHEFRTPLTVIKGQIEVLFLKPRDTTYYIESVASILDDINNQIALINGLSNLADANANFPNIRAKEISVLELLDECVTELYRNKKYIVVLNIDLLQEDEDTLLIKGDHALLKSAIMNVMDNACKFNSRPTCKVNLACRNEYMSITVRDQGLGISKDDLPRIFDSFYRSNNSRHIQGHGIGLSLVKKIIDFYGGEINATSELGKGTKMIIYFPNIHGKNLTGQFKME